MQRRLAAILAADVVGYSRLMADDDAGTYDSVRTAFTDVVVPAIQQHDGEIFKTTGDGFLATFGSMVQALGAAIAIQEGFAARPLNLRIGLNLGDVIVADGDVFGDGVNIAARLESMAEPGAIYVSAPVVRSIGKMAGVDFVRLGPRRAKNMAEPIEVYATRWGVAAGRRVWPRRRQALAVAAAAVAIILAAGILWTHRDTVVGAVVATAAGLGGNDQARQVSVDDRPALAVLPFDNLSGDPAQTYFSDGLTEDIITDLAGQHELLVIARNSSFVYRGTPIDVRTVGAELGAEYVVEGSARRAGDRLRVTAQLVETETGAHLWSESYDRRGEDVFGVQADLTAQIVAALVSHVQRSEVEAALARPTESLRAYELVLQGRHEYHTLRAESLLRARDYFTRAIALDPSYAAAYAHLGLTYVKDLALALTGNATARDLQTGIDHIREAIRLQPDLAVGYQALSFALAQTGDYEGAMRAAERAVQLSPSDPDTLEALAKAQVRFGAYENAVANAERALRLHPFAPPYYAYVYGQALYAAGRYEEADDVLRECLLRVPDERGCLRIQAAVLVRLDRLDEAREVMVRLRAIEPAFSLAAERRTERFGASPLMDRYLADLEVAGTPPPRQVRAPIPLNRST